MSNVPATTVGAVTGWFSNGPCRSKTVIAALVAIVIGTAFWFSNPEKPTSPADPNTSSLGSTSHPGVSESTSRNWSKPLPFFVPICASYVGGYCLGWFFRRVLRLILVVVAVVIAGLMFWKFTGGNIDKAEDQVKRAGTWAKTQAQAAQDSLRNMLPSATGGGMGIFLGFRRRNKRTTPPAESEC